MNLIALIAADPNISEAFRNAMTRREARRFCADPQPLTDFGSISDPGSERSREVREQEADDERFESVWGAAE